MVVVPPPGPVVTGADGAVVTTGGGGADLLPAAPVSSLLAPRMSFAVETTVLGELEPPPGGVVTPPVEGGVVTPPVEGGVVTPPVEGGVVTPPVEGGVVTPPVEGETLGDGRLPALPPFSFCSFSFSSSARCLSSSALSAGSDVEFICVLIC